MITLLDFYHVMTAVVPLYVAMILAYGSVKWWKIFSPGQCSGINRFVALFAVPLLSFHFISSNNPYTMNFRFIAADTLQKLVVLALLTVWSNVSKKGCLDWTITLFSLSTLPNTLVMGIPLLKGMYGEFSGSLMVQIVVLQCIIWYTLMLFMFEYRSAKLLITEQFPDTAGSIVSINVDADVVSLDGRDMLQTDAEIKEDGKFHVTVRRSNASRSDIIFRATPRLSNMTNAEIYSLHSSRNPTPRGSSFNLTDLYSMMAGGRRSNYGLTDAGSKGPTPRPSISDEEIGNASKSWLHYSAMGDGTHYPAPNADVFPPSGGSKSISTAAATKGPNGQDPVSKSEEGMKDLHGNESDGEKGKAMPPTSVMTRLILIMVWRKLIRNPNTYSSLIGLTWSLISFRWNIEMPAIIAKSISILSDAGLGMAMFSLGLFMALQPRMIACGNSTAAFAMAVRFVTGPAVMVAASAAVGLRGVLLHVAIVQVVGSPVRVLRWIYRDFFHAALPQGIVPFVFAKEYNVHPDILSTAVIFGMLIALPITLVYYIILGL